MAEQREQPAAPESVAVRDLDWARVGAVMIEAAARHHVKSDSTLHRLQVVPEGVRIQSRERRGRQRKGKGNAAQEEIFATVTWREIVSGDGNPLLAKMKAHEAMIEAD